MYTCNMHMSGSADTWIIPPVLVRHNLDTCWKEASFNKDLDNSY